MVSTRVGGQLVGEERRLRGVSGVRQLQAPYPPGRLSCLAVRLQKVVLRTRAVSLEMLPASVFQVLLAGSATPYRSGTNNVDGKSTLA